MLILVPLLPPLQQEPSTALQGCEFHPTLFVLTRLGQLVYLVHAPLGQRLKLATM